MPKILKKIVNPNILCMRYPGTTELPICAQAPQCTQCRAEAKRVFARRSKQKAKLKIVNLQQESIELEAQLDDQEEVCNEIWAEKLAFEQSIFFGNENCYLNK